MLDGARGLNTLPVRERLERLQRYTTAWEQLRWTSYVPLRHLVGCQPPSGIENDVIVVPRLCRASLCVQQIPSALRAITEYHSVYPVPFGLHLSTVVLDPAQDLIVFEEVAAVHQSRIHAYSLFTGASHPLACTSAVMNAIDMRARVHDICGDFLVGTVPLDHGTLLTPILRNWKSGNIEVSPEPLNSRHCRSIATSDCRVSCGSPRFGIPRQATRPLRRDQ
ncbi:hypothetical protein BV25DRAFT_764362 [Artomyces pyxidatus]|uniref:Uncharacterized protein n=1 Tax=Artomyces pyxidatus TaxID=48021 RepID=A0ACB8SZ62_9AGAM|nr:hypothetical protein BV25DRAFT_764362 [Artomyces pyxidatus]